MKTSEPYYIRGKVVEAHILGTRIYLIRNIDDSTDFYQMKHYLRDSGSGALWTVYERFEHEA